MLQLQPNLGRYELFEDTVLLMVEGVLCELHRTGTLDSLHPSGQRPRHSPTVRYLQHGTHSPESSFAENSNEVVRGLCSRL